MRKLILSSTALALALTFSGCATMSDTQRHTATGAGVGALAGAALGSVTGGKAGTGALIGASLGALGTYIWSSNLERQKHDMEVATQGTGVGVTQMPDNQLRLDIPSDISFAVGSAAISPSFSPVLEKFAHGLRSNPQAEVRIVGHTDSTGNDAINNPLSVNRAAATRDYLITHGVAAQMFTVEGHGSSRPIASNDNAAGRAQNRRVEIYVGERAR